MWKTPDLSEIKATYRADRYRLDVATEEAQQLLLDMFPTATLSGSGLIFLSFGILTPAIAKPTPGCLNC